MSNERLIKLHIGFDDTDSLKGNCTTYVATKIIEKIHSKVRFLDYPRLIRNNPNIPWKTRGNGSVALSMEISKEEVEKVIDTVISLIKENHEEDKNTNPGMVAVTGKISSELSAFSHRALTEIISLKTAKKFAEKNCLTTFSLGNGRGIVGALAAIGNQLDPVEEDFTYELLTYRIPANIGTKRQIDFKSVKEMDQKLQPYVFNNIDEESGKMLIAPMGKDPVLYGIRGENAEILLNAMKMIIVYEPIERYCIFRTNQGTDQHFKYGKNKIKNFHVFAGELEVLSKPQTYLGGHTFFYAKVSQTEAKCAVAAFEPTKGFRKAIRKLCPNDHILAFGGIKYSKEHQIFTLQLEKCQIINLAPQFKVENPFCPNCGKRMISNGTNKGYKCRNCGYKDRHISKIKKPIVRDIKVGEIWIPPGQAQRHLVKPYRRYKLPKKEEVILIQNWWQILR
ncbi:MAG: TiaS agmantine-binding domain-containing protein [Candidatus Heimdallarchaeaceae archaeon]